MATSKGISNQIKGKWKQVEGSVNQQAGKGAKGGWQKIEGKFQDGLGKMQNTIAAADKRNKR